MIPSTSTRLVQDREHSLSDVEGAGPVVSVVICTYNRSNYVVKTIQSLLRQKPASNTFEIIVVDNASTDETRLVIEALQNTDHACIRYVYESRQGVSYARNTGLQAARGSITAYIDDDEEASPGWLQGIVEAFSNVVPEPGVCCGPVNPCWQEQPPRWLVDEFRIYLSVLSLPPKPTFLYGAGSWFPEGNSAFRTEVLRKIGGFPVDVGRKGDLLLSGEFKVVEERLRSIGRNIYYQPSMKVDHFIPAERVKLPWLMRRAYFQGLSDAIDFVGRKRYNLQTWIRHSVLYAIRIIQSIFGVSVYGAMRFLPLAGRQVMVRYVRNCLDLQTRIGWFYGFLKHSHLAG